MPIPVPVELPSNNLADLALLSQGLLKGSNLTNFINRSVDLLGIKDAEVGSMK